MASLVRKTKSRSLKAFRKLPRFLQTLGKKDKRTRLTEKLSPRKASKTKGSLARRLVASGIKRKRKGPPKTSILAKYMK